MLYSFLICIHFYVQEAKWNKIISIALSRQPLVKIHRVVRNQNQCMGTGHIYPSSLCFVEANIHWKNQLSKFYNILDWKKTEV